MLLKEAKKAGGEAPFSLNNRKLRPSNLSGDVGLGITTQEIQAGSDTEDGGLMNAMAQLAWEKDINLNATVPTNKTDVAKSSDTPPVHPGSASKARKRGTTKNSKVSPSPEGSVPNSAGSRSRQDPQSEEEQKRQKPHASKNNMNNNSSTQMNPSVESMNSTTSLSKLLNIRMSDTYSRNENEEF